MNTLFVVAHPDDEALGGGATISKLTAAGHAVDVYILNTFDNTQYKNNEDHRKLVLKSDGILGVRNVYLGEFEDSEMQNASHRMMVKKIEEVILESKPTLVFTQHPGDINSDHFWCFQSVTEAIRIGQRQRYEIDPIKGLYLMEVLSSTDWHLNSSVRPFQPNVFMPVEKEDLDKKIKALSVYKGVLRNSPHPRRPETIMAQALLRGGQAGYHYAEAFECVFRRGL